MQNSVLCALKASCQFTWFFAFLIVPNVTSDRIIATNLSYCSEVQVAFQLFTYGKVYYSDIDRILTVIQFNLQVSPD